MSTIKDLTDAFDSCLTRDKLDEVTLCRNKIYPIVTISQEDGKFVSTTYSMAYHLSFEKKVQIDSHVYSSSDPVSSVKGALQKQLKDIESKRSKELNLEFQNWLEERASETTKSLNRCALIV